MVSTMELESESPTVVIQSAPPPYSAPSHYNPPESLGAPPPYETAAIALPLPLNNGTVAVAPDGDDSVTNHAYEPEYDDID